MSWRSSGDIYEALSRLNDLGIGHLSLSEKTRVAKALAPFARDYRRTPRPPEEVRSATADGTANVATPTPSPTTTT
ncbi:MAG: hypothetical protein QM747_07880 [Nocardioides sp.]